MTQTDNTLTPKPVKGKAQRQTNIILITGICIALALIAYFAIRLARQAGNRPTFEPVAAWMSVPHVARSYGLRRDDVDALYAAIDEPPPARGPGTKPDRRPIGEIARAQGKEASVLVEAMQRYLDARPRPGPGDRPDSRTRDGDRPTRQP
jgi:hypothetical protein